jgi:glycosyltransferase involved in cell wall biosynthesis
VNNNTTQSAIEMDVVSASRQETIGESILYFGRLSIEKGVHILLQTAKLTPNINYRIAGVGPEKNNLEKYVKDNNLKNVVFLGFLEKEKLATEITEARLIVVPSIWYEVFGLNITESMIKGKVVLGANIGAISEILPPELLFLPNNPHDLAEMIKIWYNKPFAELENMGQKLKLQAEKIGNPDKYLADLLAIYAKIQTEKL